MKIAINARLLQIDRMEGIARYIYEISKRLAQRNPEVEFHLLFDRPFHDDFIFESNINAHVLGPPTRHPLLWYYWFEYVIPKFLQKHKIDAFFSGDMYLSLKTDVPTYYTSHDLNYIHFPQAIRWSHLKFLQHFFPLYHKKAKHIFTVSEYSKQDIMTQYNLDAEKISVTYNATPDGFQPISIRDQQILRDKFTDGKPYYLYVGSMHPRKNLVNLVEAYLAYRTQNKDATEKLVLFGRVAFKNSALFEIVNNSEFINDIVFLNETYTTVQEILPGAKALFYISKFEGFGIPILEGFKSGVPVVTSNISSMPEVAGDAAMLVNPFDIDEISQAMCILSNNPLLRASLVEKGFKREKCFSWEESTKIVEKVILHDK